MLQQPFRDQEETGIGGIEFITQKHVACVLLLDTSGSMSHNNAITKVNQGIRVFKDQTLSSTNDEITKSCIDVALISFGTEVVLHTANGGKIHRGEQFNNAFVPVRSMNTPNLEAGGSTPMGAALDWALDLTEMQKERYKALGTPYSRPWIFGITDGEPNDNYEEAARRLRQYEKNKKVLGYCVGVDNYNRDTMATIFDQERLYELSNQDFTGLFRFLSNSLTIISKSGSNINALDVDAPHTLRMAF